MQRKLVASDGKRWGVDRVHHSRQMVAGDARAVARSIIPTAAWHSSSEKFCGLLFTISHSEASLTCSLGFQASEHKNNLEA